jgi:hypothetical protein
MDARLDRAIADSPFEVLAMAFDCGRMIRNVRHNESQTLTTRRFRVNTRDANLLPWQPASSGHLLLPDHPALYVILSEAKDPSDGREPLSVGVLRFAQDEPGRAE